MIWAARTQLCLVQTSIVTGSESSLRAGSSAWCVNISLKIAKSNCHSNVSLVLINCQEEQASCFRFTGKSACCFPARGGSYVLEWGLQEGNAVYFGPPAVILLHLWWGMTREKNLENHVIDLVTVQLNAWDCVFLELVCCHVSQPSLSHSPWVAYSCQDDLLWMCSVSRRDHVLTCNCFYTSADYSWAWKKAVDSYNWHMANCGLIFLV